MSCVPCKEVNLLFYSILNLKLKKKKIKDENVLRKDILMGYSENRKVIKFLVLAYQICKFVISKMCKC